MIVKNYDLQTAIQKKFSNLANFARAIKRPRQVVSEVVNGSRNLPRHIELYWSEILGVDVNGIFPEP